MTWTRNKPTKAGWWWRRRVWDGEGGPKSLVEVVRIKGKLCVFTGDFSGYTHIKDFQGEWSSEPIAEPAEE